MYVYLVSWHFSILAYWFCHFVDSVGFSAHGFISLFLVCIPCISFSSFSCPWLELAVLCWIRMMSEHPLFVHNRRRNTFSLLLLSVRLAWVFCTFKKLSLKTFPCILIFLKVVIMNRYWIFSMFFLHQLMWSCDFLFFL